MSATWPYLEGAITKYMTEVTGKRTGTRAPSNLEELAAEGYHRVSRGPGSDDGVTDSPLLDVESFGTTESDAWESAEDARQALLGLRGKSVDGVLFDTVDTASGPVLVSWGNPAISRYVASYRIAFRKQFSTPAGGTP